MSLREARKLQKELNVFVTLADKEGKGNAIVVKDNICTSGIQTTAGAKILEGYVPPYDATVISRLKEKGFYVLGRTTQDAFGFGSFSVNSAYGVPKNPHDVSRSAGGSSGGTAAFVAASKFVNYGLGQSTGGSIACPASFCGVVGLTPTYGLVSRYGLIDYASSFDRIGPITKTVKQAAELLSIIAGQDDKDMACVGKREDYVSFVEKNVRGKKVGVVREGFGAGVDSGVSEIVRKAIDKLKDVGAEVEEVSVPFLDVLIPAYYIIAMAEASTNLARYSGLRYGKQGDLNENYAEYFSNVRGEYFGAEEKRRVLLGTFVRSKGYSDKYYEKAQKIRKYATRFMHKLFEKFEVLVMPTMPFIAPKFSDISKMSATQVYQADLLTIPASITGLPSITVPVGSVGGMPVGLQFIGKPFSEGTLISFGSAYEKARS